MNEGRTGMRISEATYEISGQAQVISEKLHAVFRIRREIVPSRTRTYYDTFDWRLYRHGSMLEAQGPPGKQCIRWESLPGGDGRSEDVLLCTWHPMSVAGPFFAEDLPPDGYRDKLMSLVEMRRLLPVVQLKHRGHCLHILDQREKTVVRVLIEEGAARTNGAAEPRTEAVEMLRVIPVRGYDKACRRVRRLIEGCLGSMPVSGGVMTLALRAVGGRPGDYSSRLKLHIKADMPTDAVVRDIHRTLLRMIRVNEPGLRRNLDAEFLHDFRVAVRRTRSVLSRIKQVFPDEAVVRFREAFAWLGRVTGPTRDLDVYLLKTDAYKAGMSASVQKDLDPLLNFLHTRRQYEHRCLVRKLDTDAYRGLIRDWRIFLDEAAGPNDLPANAGRPIRDVASERIWRVYRRLYKNGRMITPDTPAEVLHDLRKESKKLRYLLELFRSLYPSDEIRPLTRPLKQLQDNLGDFNDYEVQQHAINGFADLMMAENRYPASVFMAMGHLVERLELGQKKERARFQSCFAKFSEKKNRQRFKRLFQSGIKEL